MRMGRLVTGMGLVLLTTVWAQAQSVDYVKAVATAQKEGDLGAVNRLCNDWIEAKPGDDRPRLILGRLLLGLDKIDQALEHFELAAEANPLSAEPRCEIGNVFLKARKYDEAVKEYDHALKTNREYVPALVGKARAKLAQGDAQAALAEAQRAGQHRSDDPAVSALLGEVLSALGLTDKALGELQAAHGKDSANADLCHQYAATLELAGRVEDAQAMWKQFLALEPTGKRALCVRNGWVILAREEFSALPSPAVSPDGRYMAFPVWAKGIFRAPFDDPGKRTLLAPWPEGGSLRHLAWSPDGTKVIYNECGKKLTAIGRNRIVAAVPGHESELIELPGSAAYPSWAPCDEEILFSTRLGHLWIWADSVAEPRVLELVGRAAKGLVMGRADYIPNGRELVVQTTHLKSKLTELCRVSRDKGEVLGSFADLGQIACGGLAVSPDGTTVAAMALGSEKPSYVVMVSTTPPCAHVRLFETIFGYINPSWHPESRMIVAAPADKRKLTLAIARLGGLDRRPVGIALERNGQTLTVLVTGRTKERQAVDLRWEAFDADSLRVGAPGESEAPVELKPGERVEWPISLTPEQAKSAVTVKVTVLNQDGVGAVKLVDWVEEAER